VDVMTVAWAVSIAIGAILLVALVGLLLYVAVLVADIVAMVQRRLRPRDQRSKVDVEP
jgi:hypothetical protein